MMVALHVGKNVNSTVIQWLFTQNTMVVSGCKMQTCVFLILSYLEICDIFCVITSNEGYKM